MNEQWACDILGLSSSPSPSREEIRQAYRMKVLLYHPDKSKTANSAEKFMEVQAAYHFLVNQEDDYAEAADVYEDYTSYNRLLRVFLWSILKEEFSAVTDLSTPFVVQLCMFVLEKASQSGVVKSFLKNINRPALKLLYAILLRYGEVLHVPEEFTKSIESILREPYTDEYIVLNPLLEDLLSEENIYKLKYRESTYYVPLWHHDMLFDHEGRDLIVKCFPVLPEHMEIDEQNRLTVHLEYRVDELFGKCKQVVQITPNHSVSFNPEVLNLTKELQHIVVKNAGIPVNNVSDLMNCEKKQDIVLSICVRET